MTNRQTVQAGQAVDDELTRVRALAARAACRRTTPQYLEALRDSVEQACCLPAGFDWGRKAAAHAQIVNPLADAAVDPVLALLLRDVPGWLHDLMVAVGPTASSRACSGCAACPAAPSRSASPSEREQAVREQAVRDKHHRQL